MTKPLKLAVLGSALLGVLTFTNCEGFQSWSVQEAIFSSHGVVIPGVSLYNSNCSTCHGSFEMSTKRNVTSKQIKDAIATKPAMNHLSNLSSVQIAQIAEALGMPVRPPGDGTRPSQFRPVVHNRHMLKSHLREVFTADEGRDTNDTNIETVINRLVGDKSEAFGGNCSRYDAGCMATNCGAGGNGDCKGILDGHMNASPVPVFNTISKGYSIKVCEEILAIDKSVSTALAKAGLDVSSPITEENITTFIKYFHRQRNVSISGVAQLIEQNRRSVTLGFSSLDQWRLVILPICISINSDLI